MTDLARIVMTMPDSEELPASVFHYTDLQGAVKILEDETLRATHLDFMNDRGEGLARDEVAKIIEMMPSDDIDWWSAAGKFKSDLDRGDTTWVTCFTNLADDVGMWRGYGDRGVAIEFDTAALKKALKPVFFERVMYARVEMVNGQKILDTAPFAQRIEQLARARFGRTGMLGDGSLAGLGALVKSEAWRAESEIRLVEHRHTHRYGDRDESVFDGLKYTVSRYGLRPSIDLSFSGVGCVRSLRVGPGPFQTENAKALDLLIRPFETRYNDAPDIRILTSTIDMR